jgi:ubiquinone biosynthesis protein COQ9
MTIDPRDIRDDLIDAALPHVPFDGWSKAALRQAATDIGMDPADADALFPGAARDMIAWHSQMADRRMMEALAAMDLESLKIRERIATAVMTRLEMNAEHREAIRRALTILAMPRNASLSLKLLYHTVDDMWFAAGDRSTDWNFYSKRLLLSGVYSSTLLAWLEDGSEDFADTRAFLDRRIQNVMQVPKIQNRLKQVANLLPRRVGAFRAYGRMRG